MTVQAVHRRVELAADEILDLRRVEVELRSRLPLPEPGDPLGLLVPEAVRIRDRPVVERAVLVDAADARLLGELLRDLDQPLTVVSHAEASCSQGPCTLAGSMERSQTGGWRMVKRSEEHTSELQSRFDLVC